MATYYVDVTAANDTGDGSVGSPKQLIASGIALMSNNDTLNVKASGTYTITTGISTSLTGITVQGYTTTVGDGGRSVITTDQNIVPLTLSGANSSLLNFDVSSTYGSGNNNGTVVSGVNSRVKNCVSHGHRGHGLSVGRYGTAIECETYGNGTSASYYGFVFSSDSSLALRCISHDNTGQGFHTAAANRFVSCIADSNNFNGFNVNADCCLLSCDSYNNGGSGLASAGATSVLAAYIENCNFIKNVGSGISYSFTSGRAFGEIVNCRYGAGTMANGSANAISGLVEIGCSDYASNVTPWVDPVNGDFRINLDAAKNTGRGVFTETASSYAGTVGYPDIGAAFHLPASAGMISVGMDGGF